MRSLFSLTSCVRTLCPQQATASAQRAVPPRVCMGFGWGCCRRGWCSLPHLRWPHLLRWIISSRQQHIAPSPAPSLPPTCFRVRRWMHHVNVWLRQHRVWLHRLQSLVSQASLFVCSPAPIVIMIVVTFHPTMATLQLPVPISLTTIHVAMVHPEYSWVLWPWAQQPWLRVLVLPLRICSVRMPLGEMHGIS